MIGAQAHFAPLDNSLRNCGQVKGQVHHDEYHSPPFVALKEIQPKKMFLLLTISTFFTCRERRKLFVMQPKCSSIQAYVFHTALLRLAIEGECGVQKLCTVSARIGAKCIKFITRA